MEKDHDTTPSLEQPPRSSRALFVVFGLLVVVVIALGLLVLGSFENETPEASGNSIEQPGPVAGPDQSRGQTPVTPPAAPAGQQ